MVTHRNKKGTERKIVTSGRKVLSNAQ